LARVQKQYTAPTLQRAQLHVPLKGQRQLDDEQPLAS